jgi:microcompartment protein CcmK/EutM
MRMRALAGVTGAGILLWALVVRGSVSREVTLSTLPT